MTPLEKIEKLLINQGIPGQALIDYKIDKIVDEMIEKYLNPKDETNKSYPEMFDYLEEIIDENKDINVGNNRLSFLAKVKDFDTVFTKIKLSLERYSPYVTIDEKSDPLYQKKEMSLYDDDCIVSMGFCLRMFISPQMKKSAALNNELERTLQIKEIKSPKVKI